MAESTSEGAGGTLSALQNLREMQVRDAEQVPANPQPVLARQGNSQDSATHIQDGPLTCQWCTVPIPEGQTTCSRCGSQGVPDANMMVPGGEVRRLSDYDVAEKTTGEIAELDANEPDADADGFYKNSASQQGETAPLIFGMIGVVILFVFIGVLAGPLLAPAIESVTGAEADDSAGLRRLGGLIGLIAGFFLATIGLWLTGRQGKS